MNPSLLNSHITAYKRGKEDWFIVIFTFNDKSTEELHAPGQYYKMIRRQLPSKGSKKEITAWIRRNEP